MRTFAQIPVGIWNDRRFSKLGDDGKLAFLYIWSSPHTLSAGVYRLPSGYAAVDLDWTIDRWQAAFKLVEDQGLIESDPETEEVLILEYLTLVKPPNANTEKVIKGQIANVRGRVLREKAFSLFGKQNNTSETLDAAVPKHLDTSFLKQSKK